MDIQMMLTALPGTTTARPQGSTPQSGPFAQALADAGQPTGKHLAKLIESASSASASELPSGLARYHALAEALSAYGLAAPKPNAMQAEAAQEQAGPEAILQQLEAVMALQAEAPGHPTLNAEGTNPQASLVDTLAELPDAASRELLSALGQVPSPDGSLGEQTAASVTPNGDATEASDASSQAVLAALASEARAGQEGQRPSRGVDDARSALASVARPQQQATTPESNLQEARREAATFDGGRSQNLTAPLDARRGEPLPTTAEAANNLSRTVPMDTGRPAAGEPTGSIVAGASANGAHAQSPLNSASALPQGATGQTAAQAALSAPVQSPAWPGQLGQQLVQFARQRGEQQIEMRLHPAELGPLSVTLKVTEQGAHAQFLSAHAPVRQAIEQAIPQLRDALAEQGIALNDTSVGEQRQQDGQAFAGGDGQAGRGEGGGDVATEAGPATDTEGLAAHGMTEVTLDGRVNLYA